MLGIYVFIVLSIPVGAYLASHAQTYKSKASETNTKSAKTSSILPLPDKESLSSGAKQLLGLVEESKPSASSSPNPAPSDSSPTIASSYGPTMSFTALLEGRPQQTWATKLFIGIIEGALTSNPKFLLTFSVDLPASGQYSNLSLAGLTAGTQYTALLKGSVQIATSSSFVMTPTTTVLNEGQPINMLTGDLNEDNIINTADYNIIQNLLGKTKSSANWNENADFNKDGVINTFDLSFISKNMGKAGASGAWTSPLPKVSSPSASLVNDSSIGGPSGQQGYWMWIPR
ncbi:hypothetical protein HYW41_03000 [Candidatus Daviesbacteria bacterium]|nr:hypothetical protein [Candidatus Daviesbacteria bacterium]